MDYEYSVLRERAISIENMYRNMLDVPRNVIAEALRNEFRELITDIRAKKHPNSLEQRIVRIQNHLIQSRSGGREIMRIDENVELHKHCEQFKMELRKFHHYQR